MKNKIIKTISVAAFIIGLGSSIAQAQQAPTAPNIAAATTPNSEVNWREEYAYHLGMQAYVYGFPAIYYAKLRFGMVERPMGRVNIPINTFFHAPLADATDQTGGSPNHDTNYSIAWVDLRQEAMVVETPAANRFSAVEFTDFYSDGFAYSGASVNQGRAEKVLLVGPNWRGTKPRGISRIIRSPSNWAFLLARTYAVEGPDAEIASAIQRQISVKPLSVWQGGPAKPEMRDVLNPSPPNQELADFVTMNAVMKESPPPPRDDALMRQFARIGLGPLATGPISELDAATKRGLARALIDGPKLLESASKAGGNTRVAGTWFYGDINWGRMAERHDFLGRASPQAYAGIVENWVEICTKLRTFIDSDGVTLDGSQKYALHFAREQIPVAREFWSITMYDSRYNMVANPIHRYTINNRTEGVKYNADGSLDIYIQPERPEGEKAANWLPSKAGEPFNLFLRAYGPGASILNQTYVPPSVTKVAN